MSLPDAPNTLREKYYSVMAGQNDADILPDIETAPSTENRYLDYIARNGGGGGGGDVTKDYVDEQDAKKTDKVTSAISGNFAGLDESGNLTDSGKTATDFATASDMTAVQGVIPSTATTQNKLATASDVTGEDISSTSTTSPITDSADGYVQGVTVKGHSEKSKNLWRYGDITGITQATVVMNYPTGLYTLSGIATSDDTDTNVCLIIGYSESTAIFSTTVQRNTRFSYTFNTSGNLTQIVFYASDSFVHSEGNTFSFTEIQLEEGSTATSYEPFGIKSIGDAGWGVVDLGTLTWTYNSEIQAFNSEISNIKINSNNDIIALCAVYNSVASYTELIATNKTTWINNTQHKIVIRDTSYTDATAFKSAMSGVLLYYPLADTTGATPTFGITSKNGEGQGTAATITTGLPLRSTLDGTVYDELTNEKVITRCEVVEGDVVPLATPVETPLTSTEIAALASLQTYNSTTHISATDAPTMTVDYLLNTNNGQAVADIQKDLQEQIDDLSDSFAETVLYDNMNLMVEPAANVQLNLSQPYTNFDEIKIEYAYYSTAAAANNTIYPYEYSYSVAEFEAMRTSLYNGRKGYLLLDRYLSFVNMYISMDITSTSVLTINDVQKSSSSYKHYITKITGIKY